VRVLTAVLVPTLAAWNNLLVPRLSAPAYTVLNAAAAGVLVGTARAAGLTRDELGLDPRRLRAGAAHGAAVAAPLVAGYAAGLASPALRPALRDARVAGLTPRRVAAEALLRIPLGTVLWEEIAFRGVLDACLRRRLAPRPATAAGAVLFGFWHVHPTLAGARANDLAPTPRHRTTAVLLGTAATGAAGVLFTELRRRSGSLLAPAVLHLAANSLGLLAAAAAHRLPRRGHPPDAVGNGRVR
jgi:membrane protease YdiL (CAAX protease family)